MEPRKPQSADRPAASRDAAGLAAGLESKLRDAIDGEVRFDRIARAIYSTDASVYQIMPLGVVIPRSRDDVIKTVRLCGDHGVSITPRGAGTSQAGQAIGAGVQIDFSKYLNRVLVLNPGQQWVRVEPGIVLDDLNAVLKPYGLWLPLDISTSDRATIGGMISNNSSGTRSVVYGKTLDYVLELTAVLADGSVVEMRPLAEPELSAKCAQPDREGDCCRTVRRLAAEYAAEIERRYPKILRRVGGYNLDEFVAGPGTSTARPFNLTRLIVGSEGTLAVVLDAKLRLAPLPPERAIAVVHFHDLLESLAATPCILQHRPSAVELVDRFILNTTRGRTEFEPLREFIAGDPAAVLIVEFFAEGSEPLADRVSRLEAELKARSLGYHFHRATDPAAQAKIWKLRRAALGLSMSERGDAKAISFVEDTAVSPDRLRDYIARFQQILTADGTHAGFYAHASVGLLHVRPVVNLKTTDGVQKFERIASEIANLVLEFGGALSGEHGDGLVRSPFQAKMFGPVLYDAFRQIKRAFDPAGILNPGKIVDAAPLAAQLRFGPGYETREPATIFDFGDFGGLAHAAEQCGGVGECRKTSAGTMCPSYMATRDEIDSTRGRANALRLAIAGQLGPASLADRELYRVMDLCLECKACKSECPTGVDMARLKSEFLHQYHAAHGLPLRTRLLAHPDRAARWGCRLTPVSNWLLRARPVRWLAEQLVDIDRRRVPPRFARETFEAWWSRRGAKTGTGRGAEIGPATVVLYADTFSNFYEPQNAGAAVELMEAFGERVNVSPRVCCGRPLISKGLLHEARAAAEATVRALVGPATQGLPIVFLEPSCYSAVRDDHPHLLRGELAAQSRMIASACIMFEEWAAKRLASPASAWTSRLDPCPSRQVLLHTHCHHKALLGAGAAMRTMEALGGSVVDLDAGCCGMAGSFGYERDHYDVSRAIGERRLFPAVRARPAGAIVVAAGFSCRHQIEHFTGVEALHPAFVLRSALAADG
jgi:FAD/FMN-containing dehydrogenase/Fe-S oxidoreductase